MNDVRWNSMELMICLAARYLEDGATVVVGTGAPCAAVVLAQKVYSPNLLIIFEAGGIGARLPAMPISVGDSRTFFKGVMASTMPEIMEMCQRGMVDYAFLGGAQIDMYGNMNSTVIGNYRKPKVRLPGSGGANDLASLCWRTIVMMPQDRRRFVQKVDFITTPGFLDGRQAREAAGLPEGTGPFKVVTDLCIMGFDEPTGRMTVESLHPGITREDTVANTSFDLLWASDVKTSQPPSRQELTVLREEVDPFGYILGRSS